MSESKESHASARLTCPVCPRACRLAPGQAGACRTRVATDAAVIPKAYGRLTSLALDPVEKKPLACWHPGSYLLSVGSYGCNFHCPFCQNWQISQVGAYDVPWQEVSPKELVALTLREHARDPHVIGIAHTYNEPLVCWEYVRDVGRLAHEVGLANVLVSNGCANAQVIDVLAPLIDAANIDLKTFDPKVYQSYGGELATVKETIRRLGAEPSCHLEVTTLIVPGVNDSEEEVRAIANWLAGVDPKVVLHVTRFFPRWHMQDRPPTPVDQVYHLADIAREHLDQVFVGNC